MLTHRDTIRTLAEAVRAALGDLAPTKRAALAIVVFCRQCRALIAADGAYAAAIRDEAAARVAAYWPDAEMQEKVSTDDDPNHPFWLLSAPEGMLRRWGASKVNPGGGAMTLGGIAGRVVFGPPPDEDAAG
jgi:hypothetical protein